MKKYDDASWHAGGDFPADLGYEHACTHIGIFLAWAINRGHAGNSPAKDAVGLVRSRGIAPGSLILSYCDGKLTEEDLTPLMNQFALAYYENGDYYRDLDKLFGSEAATLYHIKNDWSSYDRAAELLDLRFAAWESKNRRK